MDVPQTVLHTLGWQLLGMYISVVVRVCGKGSTDSHVSYTWQLMFESIYKIYLRFWTSPQKNQTLVATCKNSHLKLWTYYYSHSTVVWTQCDGPNSFVVNHRIAGDFGVEFNLAVWRIDQPITKLKSANIKSLIPYYWTAHAIALRKANWWVWSLGLNFSCWFDTMSI